MRWSDGAANRPRDMMERDESTKLYGRIKLKLKQRVVDLLDGKRKDEPLMPRDREALERLLHRLLGSLPEEERVLDLSKSDEDDLINRAIEEIVGLGPLERLMLDQSISEVMVNGPHQIYVERNGNLERVPEVFRDTQELMRVIERMLGSVGMSVSEFNPLADASLQDGSRINVIIPPLALNGPTLTIRRKLRDWTMQDFLAIHALSEEEAEFLEACVKAKVNIIISGGTSTGKTSLVSILSTFIPSDDRVITIENVPELELSNRDHWIRLVGRAANMEGQGEIPLRVLVKNALRMRPDRIILGEARGGEALDVVQAMHSGHEGILTVLHANTPRAALERLETMMLMSGIDLAPSACRMQIASAVDLVIHLGRFADGTRRVESITQVLGITQEGFELKDLFTFDAQGFSSDGKLEGTFCNLKIRPKFASKFRLNNVPFPEWMPQ